MSDEKVSGPELFFGLVGISGTQFSKVINALSNSLSKVRYESESITLSELIPLKKLGFENQTNEYNRIRTLQKAGDALREKIEDGGAMALLAMSAIRAFRETKTGSGNRLVPRQAYILKSLKTKSEILKFRKVYGNNFWVISAYTSREESVNNLANRIKDSEVSDGIDTSRKNAEDIIERDSFDPKNTLGQNVRDTFPRADVFFNVKSDSFEEDVQRFVDLIFNNTFKTPRVEEYGMFHAYASAFRSSSLSRQVGASIVSDSGDVIATGTNEVPKFGGGHYVEGEIPDHREFHGDGDSNHIKRNELLKDVFARLKKAEWFNKTQMEKEPKVLVDEVFQIPNLKNMKILNVTEYGREVHAEMSALMDVARRTISVKGETMYCTTFPCHICAKHIVGAGIRQVTYIEPYPKSEAEKLFPNEITVDKDQNQNKVYFKPFVGISPKRFMDLFEMSERKDEDTGKVLKWNGSKAEPRYFESRSYVDDEAAEILALSKIDGDKRNEV